MFTKKLANRHIAALSLLLLLSPGDSAEDHLASTRALVLAIEALDKGEYPAAIQRAQKLTGVADPGQANRAYLVLADANLALRQPQKAIRVCEEGLKFTSLLTPSQHAELRDRLARALEDSGERPASIIQYQQIIGLSPRSILAVRAADRAARLCVVEKDPSRAIQFWEWAIKTAVSVITDQNDPMITVMRKSLSDAHAMNAALKPKTMDPDADLLAKAEDKRKGRAFGAALGLYDELIQRKPAERHLLQARWGHGECLVRLDRWEEAESYWRAFIVESPTGAWRGLAWLGVVDILIERRFDAAAARLAIDQALEIAASPEAESHADWKPATAAIWLRKGLIESLANRHQHAVAAFERHAALAQAERPIAPVTGSPLPTPIEKLIERGRSGLPLIPLEVVDQRSANACLILALAQLYLCADDFPKCESLLRLVIEKKVPSGRPQQAYAWFQLADSLHWQARSGDASAARSVYLSEYSDQPWSADVMLREGIYLYSVKKSRVPALTMFREIARKWPDQQAAQAALWFSGLACYWDGEWAESAAMFAELQSRYPNNEWRDYIKREILPDLKKHLRTPAKAIK